MVRRSNPLIENTSSAGGTSAEGISTEMQHKESIETHVSRNKIQTIVVNIEETNTRKHEIFYQLASSSVVKNHESRVKYEKQMNLN